MNRYYDAIMDLAGMEEFKALIRKWDTLSGNMQKNPPSVPILLPDLLWVANSGVGKTKLMRLMSEYLQARGNLVDFYGDVKFFEFLLNYVPKDAPFTELQRLMDEVSEAAGFRNEYRGAILIDIDGWVEHYEEPHFVSFMEYLSANSDRWMIVLSVSEQEELHNLQAFLSMYLRLEKITLTLPETGELFGFISENLQKYGLTLSADARQLLHGTIEALRENKYFDGFKTIKMLCQDIVYEHFSREGAVGGVLTAQSLEKFSAHSDYVKTAIENAAKVHKIGFLNKE